MRVDLTGSDWAELIEPGTLTNGQRRPIVIAAEKYRRARLDPHVTRELQKAVAAKDEPRQQELLAALSLDDDELDELKIADVMITVLVCEWSLALPLPSDKPVHNEDGDLIGSDVLDDLRAYDYDRLRWAVAAMLPTLKFVPSGPQSRPTKRSTAPKRRSKA